MTIEVEYQRALYSALTAVKATLGVTAIYDVAPQSGDGGNVSVFPYITIGRVFIVASDTQTKNGFDVAGRIHTFSRTGSMLECKTIQGAVYGQLHHSTLTIPGHNNYYLSREDTDCFPDEDGMIHGVCEYRALVEVA